MTKGSSPLSMIESRRTLPTGASRSSTLPQGNNRSPNKASRFATTAELHNYRELRATLKGARRVLHHLVGHRGGVRVVELSYRQACSAGCKSDKPWDEPSSHPELLAPIPLLAGARSR
jgi:hypothetical protein